MMYCKKANKTCYYTEQCHDLPLEFLPACKDFEPTETYNKEVEEKDEERRKSQEKYEQKKRSEILGEFAKEIGRDRLEKICKAVKYIGQTGYAININMRDDIVVEHIEIVKLEIYEKDIWLIGTGTCEFYSLSIIGKTVFFGENAKQQAEKKYKELTAQSGKGE